MKFRNYTIYKFCVLSIFVFIKQKADKLIRDIRDFSFIIDCQQIYDKGISFLVKIISDDPCTTTFAFTLTSYCHSYLSDTFAKTSTLKRILF